MRRSIHCCLMFVMVVGSAALSACGGASNVEGTYVSTQSAMIRDLTFKADGKVEVNLLGGIHEGTYTVEGETLTMIAPDGTRTPFNVGSDGCLEAPAPLGRYCKGTRATESAAAPPPPPPPNPGWTGIYEAQTDQGKVVMDFQETDRLSIQKFNTANNPMGQTNYRYTNTADAVTISTGSFESILKSNGNVLEGTFMGEPIKFEKK
jgi:hypothetical protein